MFRRFGIFLFGILLGVAFVRFAFPGRFAEMGRYFSLDYRGYFTYNRTLFT